jgi:hypothetical protein
MSESDLTTRITPTVGTASSERGHPDRSDFLPLVTKSSIDATHLTQKHSRVARRTPSEVPNVTTLTKGSASHHARTAA